MIKNTVIALVAAAAFAGVAAPAMAGSLVATSDSDFNADYVLSELQHKGIDAASVEEWGDYVTALVTADDGRQTILFFNPTTLEQVAL
ncbi:hypothetical protein NIM87_06190 [Devosia sp. XJ19-1]|uniref:PepSY domain-containing protein n=1 Tax=Devosia ureilytica TaxID=2952754 RepID=A0A9Q4FQS4_9HYPH|nr:hypothetical protein [Devosia ureilytica]MCP8883081.1 hypothetical protein [Devosia ureilytica]MCP8886551.1 hypothetical protein [Devosia ureilytica]